MSQYNYGALPQNRSKPFYQQQKKPGPTPKAQFPGSAECKRYHAYEWRWYHALAAKQ